MKVKSLLFTIPLLPLVAYGQQPCPDGAELQPNTSANLITRVGSVYSSSLYNPNDTSNNNNSHNPIPVSVKVTKNNRPVSGCEVEWSTVRDSKSDGWIFPTDKYTNDLGINEAWWTAGHSLSQSVKARIKRQNGTYHELTINGNAQPHETRSNSIHINWNTPPWDAFSVDVTPLTFPDTTYYSAINFPGGYTGIQSHQVLFSVWDHSGVSAEVIESNTPGLTCKTFGGEGTGRKCEYPFEPEIGKTYRFEVKASYATSNRTDYTAYFTDVSSGQSISLGTIRYGRRVTPSGASGFIEDWWQSGSSCLDTEARTAYFSNIKYKLGNGKYTDVKTANFGAVYNQWHNEICANYYYGAKDGKFLWSSGGDELVSHPINIPGNVPPLTEVTLDEPEPQEQSYVKIQIDSSFNDQPYASGSELIFIDQDGVEIPNQNLKVISSSSEETAYERYDDNLIDGDDNTFWHSKWSSNPVALPPHDIVIALGKKTSLSKVIYKPRKDGNNNGTFKNYRIFISEDTNNWGNPIKTGTLNADNNSDKEINLEIDHTNQAPVANAGNDKEIEAGSVATLWGKKSHDPDGDTLEYHWHQLSGKNTQMLTDDSDVGKVMIPSSSKTEQYVFRLTISDGIDNSSDDVILTARPDQTTSNQPPTAEITAQSTQIVGVGTIFLFGDHSFDPDGDALSFSWKQVSGPDVAIFGENNAEAIINFDTPVSMETEYVVELYVSDGELSHTDQVTLTQFPDEQGNQVPLWQENKTYRDACQTVKWNGDIWNNIWEASPGAEPGTTGEWGVWRKTDGSQDNYCIKNP